jgi:hypothetical protein
MANDSTVAIRDCLVEIAVLQGIAARMTLETFRSDPVVRRAAAYGIRRNAGSARWGDGRVTGSRINAVSCGTPSPGFRSAQSGLQC